MQCPICHNKENNNEFSAKEMMIGMRDSFQYVECGDCGCVWLKEIPDNISDYYPKNYYSYLKRNPNSLEKFIKKQITLSRLNRGIPLFGRLLTPLFPRYLKWLNIHCRIGFDSKILDVGSGAGRLLLEMNEYGFKNLTGIDPFIERDIVYENGVKIYKKSIEEIVEQYDFLMLHHSFEHMSHPKSVLKKLKSLLLPEGSILIRIPVADSYGYEKYGSNWVELDPPRHFFLHTKKSMQLLASHLSFEIKHVLHDSSNFEIIGSEKWVKDIPSISKEKLFSTKEMKEMNRFVDNLNNQLRGSRACFYLS